MNRAFLSRRAQFARTARIGKTISGAGWKIRYAPNRRKKARLGVIIPKKIVRRAVRRNRLRRAVRESFRQQWRKTMPPVDIILTILEIPETVADARRECAELMSAIPAP